jgi:RNA polymerase sigma-70 factor, ECF subfamily
MQDASLRTLKSVTDETSERAEWDLILGGDAAAFGRLFDRHRERVFRHSCRLADSHEDAEDVLALAFLELWRLRKRVRIVNGSVLAWLLATATNVALNQRRAARRYRAFLKRLPHEEVAQDAATESMRVVLDVDPTLLSEIKAMSEFDQRLLALVAFEGFSLREAADALGTSVDASRSRWQRIRRRLASLAPAPACVLDVPEGGTR